MDHLAILDKKRKLLAKIISGEKSIESRWYKSRYPPWGKINNEEIIYFKDSGCPITLKAKVEKVLQFENLNSKKVQDILNQYGEEDGLSKEEIPRYFNLFKDKRYCMLIYLKNPQKIPPFNINKKGFGVMSAWISLPSIQEIKI